LDLFKGRPIGFSINEITYVTFMGFEEKFSDAAINFVLIYVSILHFHRFGSALYKMACTLSNLYMPATASTCSTSTSARNGAFFPCGKRLQSSAGLSSGSNQRRAKGIVVRAESSKDGALNVHNTRTQKVVDQKPRAVERATEISPSGKPLTHKSFVTVIPAYQA